MSALTIEARPFRPEDARELHELIERARATAPQAVTARTLVELEWRYARAPRGARIAFARDANGRLVACIAGTRHHALLEGRVVAWLEVGDLASDFTAGAGLVRARGLTASAAAFSEEFGGPGPEKHPVVYGLPNRRAHRICLGALEGEVLRSENQLVLDLERPVAACSTGGGALDSSVALEEVARFPAEVDGAFRAWAEGRAAVLVRDASYLDWRYADRPGQSFVRVLARRGPELAGYAVYGDGWLLDLVAPPDDGAVATMLAVWARERAREDGRTRLAAVFPDTAPEWLLFQGLGFRVQGTREYLCFKSFQRPAIMSWLFHHWSYSRGDTLR